MTDHTRDRERTPSREPSPRNRRRSVARSVAVGAASGLLASAAAGRVDAWLDPWIGARSRRRERRLREGSPHEIAGPRALRWLRGRAPSPREEQYARRAFAATYGIGWGVGYALLRRRWPALSRAGGLPFAVPFYVACDGVIAPLLGLTPSPARLPIAFDAKELTNHAAWTLTAELAHRGAERWLR